jgi:hypothetical protein
MGLRHQVDDAMSDDDETPRIGKPRARTHMSDDTRALTGAQHRRAASVLGGDGTPSERRRRRSHPQGVPVVDPIVRELTAPGVSPEIDEHEITSPYDLLERPPTPAVIDTIRRSRRNSDDPATFGDVAKLADALTEARRKEKSNNEERANQLIELLGRPPHEDVVRLQTDVHALECDVAEIKSAVSIAVISVEALTRWWKPIRAVLIFLAIAALGAVGFFVDQIMSHAESKGEATIRIEHLEHSINDLRQDLRDDRSSHRYTPEPDRAWLKPPVQKDPSP